MKRRTLSAAVRVRVRVRARVKGTLSAAAAGEVPSEEASDLPNKGAATPCDPAGASSLAVGSNQQWKIPEGAVRARGTVRKGAVRARGTVRKGAQDVSAWVGLTAVLCERPAPSRRGVRLDERELGMHATVTACLGAPDCL